MDERLLTRLREAGMAGEVSAQLLHGDAAFALSADHQLGYVDAAGARTVALRDINRIHSDREGLLRVETQNGTAITASLMGFDPAGVQAFFNQVRTSTNQAKSLPQTAIPQPSGNPWKSGWTSGAPRPADQPEGAAEPGAVAAAPAPVNGPAPIPSAPVAATLQPVPQGEATQPVVISTTPRFNPERPETAPKAPAAKPAVAKPAKGPPVNPTVQVTQPTTPNTPPATKQTASNQADKAQDARARLLQREQANAEAAERRNGAKTSAPAAPRPTPADPRARTRQSGGVSLQALAEGVSGLISTLRLLAVAMGLAAILVGVLRFRENDPVTGLWIIGSGLVAAFALLVFAQVARLLVGIAQRLQQDA